MQSWACFNVQICSLVSFLSFGFCSVGICLCARQWNYKISKILSALDSLTIWWNFLAHWREASKRAPEFLLFSLTPINFQNSRPLWEHFESNGFSPPEKKMHTYPIVSGSLQIPWSPSTNPVSPRWGILLLLKKKSTRMGKGGEKHTTTTLKWNANRSKWTNSISNK